jgi:hypothetical protein
MITINQDLSIKVSVADGQKGDNEVLLKISGTLGPVICVSPEQARRLALELVQAVSKAETRHNLQTLHEAKRPQETKSRSLGLVNPKVLQLR